MKRVIILFVICATSIYTNAQRKVVKVESQVQEVKEQTQSLKRKVAIARFSNETTYAKGVFYDKANDPLSVVKPM